MKSGYRSLTTKQLLIAGDEHLAANRFEEAINCYEDARAMASKKRSQEAMMEAWARLGGAHRRQVERGQATLGTSTRITKHTKTLRVRAAV